MDVRAVERPDQLHGGRAPSPRGGERRTMSLLGHLDELRRRLIVTALFFVATTMLALCWCEPFTNILLSLGSHFTFVYIAPAELMMTYIQVAFLGGLVATVPVIAYHLWQFLRPGLRQREKLAFGLLMTVGLGLFALGVAFAFVVVLPILLAFFAGLNTSQTVTSMVSIQQYISYLTSTMVTFGVIFETPVVLISLVGLDLVRPKTLQKNFKYVVLVVLVVAAIITPPDVTSQILVAVPLLLLFQGSVLLSSIIFRRRIRRREQEEADQDEP